MPSLSFVILHSLRKRLPWELTRQGLTQSLSGVAHCYDNARMESFFATLKKELIYRISAYRLSKEEVKTLVFR